MRDVNFTDIKVLRQAVNEMIRDGARVQLIEGDNAFMRGWLGKTEKFDAVIKITDGPYDIGFKWDDKENKYSVTTESMMHPGISGGLGTDHNSKTIEGDFCRVDFNAQVVGKLSQRYNLIRDEQFATRQGYMTKRIKGTDGVILLEAEKAG